MAKVTSTLAAGHTYKVETAAGSFTLVADQPTAVGGSDTGPTPKDFLLAAIGACTVQTLKMAAPGKKWDLQTISVEVTYSEVPDPNKPGQKITQIEERIEVSGNLSQAELDAIERTAGRCPVLKIVEGPKQVIKKAVKV